MYIVAALISGVGAYKGTMRSIVIGCTMALFLFFCSRFFPKIISRLCTGWFWIGEMLGLINSTILMFIMYFVVFTPIALIQRIGKKKSEKKSFWIKRGEQITKDSFYNQY